MFRAVICRGTRPVHARAIACAMALVIIFAVAPTSAAPADIFSIGVLRVREGIGRALAVREAKQYWQRLLSWFRSEHDRHAKDGLAVALGVLARRTFR